MTMNFLFKKIGFNKGLLVGIMTPLFLVGCINSSGNELTILFFEQYDMTAIVRLDSTDIYGQMGLRKLKIKDEKFYLLFNEAILKAERPDIIYYPDVRYKVTVDGNDVFLDYSGNFLTNKGRTGKVNFMNELEGFIRNNETLSIPIGEPIPKIN